MRKDISNRIQSVTNRILQDYQNGRDIDNMNVFNQPDSEAVVDIVNKLLNILFPGYYRPREFRSYNYDSRIAVVIEDVIYNLQKQIAIALRFKEEYAAETDFELRMSAEELAIDFLDRIPHIRALVNTDMQASYEGDPAAFSKDEIVLCYPGLLASTINRLAHELFLLGVPLIPRMMTEYAHSKTGIDIHPGATIGEYFFMDHGTGIVVGETSIIGKHVKVYQGVTIGALSTRGGQRLRGAKRHPTIEDNVTIYAGASILGGDTIIGEGSVIGSNVFITSSVRPGTRISVKTQELIIRNGDEDFELHGTPEPAEDMEESKPDDTWYYVI
ncbi:MAG: serine acetyltransferase [Lachnospiraceae bacterium]|nr:serine acetyltransferase [Lachnospiraceae bacterium]